VDSLEQGLATWPTRPPNDVAMDMLAFVDDRLPALEKVVKAPVFSRTGQLIHTHGYHEDERLYFDDINGIWKNIDVPEIPTAEDVANAVAFLVEDMLYDFPFVSGSDRAHALAALLHPTVRDLYDSCSPLHLIEAPTRGSGKGLLSKIISILTLGYVCELKTIPSDDNELRKLITLGALPSEGRLRQV
jgi:hypothetical protein